MWNAQAQENELLFEMNLTAALRLANEDEKCYNYIANRWVVLKAEILKKSQTSGEDAAEIFHRFQKGVHQRHEFEED